MAIEQEVRVCLIAGDLFEKAAIDPATLLQAEQGLSRLKERGIRTLAIAGNHDRLRYRDTVSWLDYLHKREMLFLLEPGESKWVSEGDSFVDIDGVRFIGIPWYGASTGPVLEKILEDLPQQNWDGIHFTVMMMHAAIEGEMPDVAGALRLDAVHPLHEYIDYLALGHLHKPYEAPGSEPWVYNPGAIENRTFDEAQFIKKGVFVVDIDERGTVDVKKHVIKGRPATACSHAIWHRTEYLIRDNDDKFGAQFKRVTAGIKILKTPVRAPKANAICERFLGSARRECLDQFLLLSERHLRRLVTAYVTYFNESRPHSRD